jgi:hypothetical protein
MARIKRYYIPGAHGASVLTRSRLRINAALEGVPFKRRKT